MPECGTRGLVSHAEATGLPHFKLVGSTSTRSYLSENIAQNNEQIFNSQASHIAPVKKGSVICGLCEKANTNSLIALRALSPFPTRYGIS